jgi:hypothetical protein
VARGKCRVQGGDIEGLNRDDAGTAFGSCGNAGVESAAADGDDDCVYAGLIAEDFFGDGTCAGGDFQLVVGMAKQGAAFLHVLHGSCERLRVLCADLTDGCPVPKETLDLHLRGGLRHEHCRRNPESRGGIGVGQAGIAAGRCHHADGGVQVAALPGGEEAVKGSAGFERCRTTPPA